MRYDEFRDRWLAALRAHQFLFLSDRAEEAIDLGTMRRRCRDYLLPRDVGPFSVGAKIDFEWTAFESARSYTTEEDLLTELFGRRRSGRGTQPRQVRVDLRVRAGLPYGSTTPLPSADVWLSWLESVEARLHHALTPRRAPKSRLAWCGSVELEGRTAPDGTFSLSAMSLPAFEMVVVPRIWDDPRRRQRESKDAKAIDGLAKRFNEAVEVWRTSVGELVKWLEHRPAPRTPGRPRGRRSPGGRGSGPETVH